MADTKVIVIPEGKICDYVDGKFRNDSRRMKNVAWNYIDALQSAEARSPTI